MHQRAASIDCVDIYTLTNKAGSFCSERWFKGKDYDFSSKIDFGCSFLLDIHSLVYVYFGLTYDVKYPVAREASGMLHVPTQRMDSPMTSNSQYPEKLATKKNFRM